MSSPQNHASAGFKDKLIRSDSHFNSETSSTIDNRGGYPFVSFPGDVDVDADVPELADILDEMGDDPDVVAAVEAHEEALDRLEEHVLHLDTHYAAKLKSGELPEMRLPLSPEIQESISMLSNKVAVRSPTLRPSLRSPSLRMSPTLSTRHHPSPIFVYLKKKDIPVSEETIMDVSVSQGVDLQRIVWQTLQKLDSSFVEGVVDAEQVQLTRLSGALTNCVYVVKTPPLSKLIPNSTETKSRRVLLRIYGVGVDRFVHRERELVWMCRLSSMRVGPRLIGCFGNGRFEEFVDSVTLNRLEMRDVEYSRMIAKELVRFHLLGSSSRPRGESVSSVESNRYGTDTRSNAEEKPQAEEIADEEMHAPEPVRPSTLLNRTEPITTPSPRAIERNSTLAVAGVDDASGSEIWDRLAKWYLLAQDAEEALMERDQLTKKAMVDLDLPKYAEELVLLRNILEKEVASPIVFSHNDYGNFLIRKKDGSIMIVDYEYAGYNYRGFDLANHFCEWAADYHCEKPHNLEYSKYPNKQEQLTFFNAYLDALTEIGQREWDEGEREAEVKSLEREADAYGLLSHIHWGLWGVIQAVDNIYNGTDGEFDYLEYGLQRFREYEQQKKRLFPQFPQ